MIATRIFPLPPPKAPQDAGVSMLPQDLWDEAERDKDVHLGTSPASTWLARLFITSVTLSLAAFFAYALHGILQPTGIGLLEGLFIFLASACFVWVGVGTSAALLGFVLLRLRAEPETPHVPPADTPLSTRTALLFPIYHENVASIAATIEEIAKALSDRGYGKHFSIFVLSDTRAGPDRDLETKTFEILRLIVGSRMEVFYRYRDDNVGKKAGNIQDWIVRHGGEYDHFVIFDADSVMSAETLIRMAAAMEHNQHAGLIQTVPRLIWSRTTFARLQQFAHAAYGPILARGLSAWAGQSANYWGHNAIIRTRPFAKYAGLPKLGGAPPFGGHIQSHDFVEAALLRRAGWAVYMAPQLEGSYESSPPTLIDAAVRDRRWVQGNLQHLGLITVRGLTLTSRIHLFMGAYGYLVAAFWVALMIVGILLAFPHAVGSEAKAIRFDQMFNANAMAMLVTTLIALFLPKVLGLVNWLMTDRRSPKILARTLLGTLLEVALSVVMAPVRLMTHLQSIIEIIQGRDSGWSAQRRDAAGVTLTEAMRFHVGHFVMGVALAGIAVSVSPWLFVWMLPVVTGLILAPWITWATSEPSSPLVADLLATDEDLNKPLIVRQVEKRAEKWKRFCEFSIDSGPKEPLDLAVSVGALPSLASEVPATPLTPRAEPETRALAEAKEERKRLRRRRLETTH